MTIQTKADAMTRRSESVYLVTLDDDLSEEKVEEIRKEGFIA